MKKKTRDLKKGDVITVTYGDFNNFVTCTMLEDARQDNNMWELVTDAYGKETKMYSVDGNELTDVKE